MKSLILAFLVVVLPVPAAAEGEHAHISPYAGKHQREIKSLSAEDIAELRAGGGWGLAKPAELNGVPGPSHVLKMKRELALTADQEKSVQRIFEAMRNAAVAEGKNLLAGEAALDTAFRDGSIDQDHLRTLLRRIEASRANLRYVHLAAHLQMVRVLNENQIKRYNELRGYRGKAHHQP
ncbi:periplasmic heavy metal sensor [Ensifer sp. MPMI2T]|nr:periplasmic heavy metal sensor [Ensifer sp. MPMI2T]